MADYRMTFDLHTHTAFRTASGKEILHAKGTVEESVCAAIEKGLSVLGISNHGPGHVTYGLPLDCIPALRAEIEEASHRHPEIKIYLGVEANIINPSGRLDVLPSNFDKFDYVMAGYHYGIFGEKPFRAAMIHGGNWLYEKTAFARPSHRAPAPNCPVSNGSAHNCPVPNNPVPNSADSNELRVDCCDRSSGEPSGSHENSAHKNSLGKKHMNLLTRVDTEMMIRAVEGNTLRVLTHPGDKGSFDIDALAKACESSGTWMEINDSHRDLTVEGIRTAAKYDVKFIIGSDAHSARRVGCFENALERALEAGLPIDRIVNVEKIQ